MESDTSIIKKENDDRNYHLENEHTLTQGDKNFNKVLKSPRIAFSQENVVSITKKKVPMFLQFIVSLGPKFNFSTLPQDPIPLASFTLTFESLLYESNQFGQYVSFKKDIKELSNDMNNASTTKSRHDDKSAQNFIRQQADRVKKYLKKNKNIIVAPADKGGKCIIMEKDIYETKVLDHLKSNLKDHIYFHWKNASAEECRKLLEPKFEQIRIPLNPYLAVDIKRNLKDTCHPVEFEPCAIARLFVTIKVHKEGFPVRPIIAAPDFWARPLSKWIIKKLGLIAILYDYIRVHSAEEFVKRTTAIPLKAHDHVLGTFDYYVYLHSVHVC